MDGLVAGDNDLFLQDSWALAEIDAALAGDVALCGERFIGPPTDPGDWDGYPPHEAAV